MYKLIDSGNKELDDQEGIKIPDFIHVDRDRTENNKMTEVEKPDEPEEMPEIPERKWNLRPQKMWSICLHQRLGQS